MGPYSVETYVARDGSEARMPFSGIYCSVDGSSVRRLELEFKRLGPYEDGMTGPTDPRPAGRTPDAEDPIYIVAARSNTALSAD